MSRIMFALVALAVAAPAQAQTLNREWSDCVVAQLRPEEALQGSVATGAIAVSIRCKAHFRGKPGEDVDDAVALIERIRKKLAEREPIVGPASPLPPGDKRF